MSIIKNFPSAADLDLDMWRAVGGNTDGYRHIEQDTERVVSVVHYNEAQRDTTARRIEMLGDLYDTLRELAEQARQAGLDITQAHRVMSEFVAPKPFSGTDENGEG